MTKDKPVTVTQAFQREERFIVIKRKHLSSEAEYDIRSYLGDNDITTVECVVVESDWPEYETVWQMIEARTAHAPSQGWCPTCGNPSDSDCSKCAQWWKENPPSQPTAGADENE